MGAYQFTAYGFGATMPDAFHAAKEQALYEHGHGGYSGTIAEKPGAILFPLPKGMTAEKFERLICEADEFSTEGIGSLREDLRHLHRELAKGGVPRARRTALVAERKRYEKYLRDAERARAKFLKAAGPHVALIERASGVYNSKWDEAVAVKLTGAEAKRARAWLRVERKRGDVYKFMGMASS